MDKRTRGALCLHAASSMFAAIADGAASSIGKLKRASVSQRRKKVPNTMITNNTSGQVWRLKKASEERILPLSGKVESTRSTQFEDVH